MNAGQISLGNFESRLLGELRRAVAEGAVAEAPARAADRRTLTPRRLAIAGAVTATIAGAAIIGLSIGGEPAYAVDANPDGTVTVTIRALSDAVGLQNALADAGVRALVQYIPEGKRCAGDSTPPPPPPTGDGESGVMQVEGPESGGPTLHSEGKAPAGEPEAPLETMGTSKGADGSVVFTITSHQPRNETLVIRTQTFTAPGGPTVDGAGISVTPVTGHPHPCKLVDVP